MVDRLNFTRGLDVLAAIFNRTLTDEARDAYFAYLADDFTDETWAAAVKRLVRTGRFFPVPADFLAPQNATAAVGVDLSAAAMFERVKGCTVDSRALGKIVSRSVVEKNLPAAALAAFDVAGGKDAFNAEPIHPMTRKAFIEAYTRLAAGQPDSEPRTIPPLARQMLGQDARQ